MIGLGRSGWGIHCAYLSKAPEYELVAVVDPIEARRNEAIETLGVKRAYATPEELFADGEVELVVVATPSHTHKALAIEALEAKKHVQVEKPFALNVAEADEMIAAAKANDRILTCFQNRRADPDFLKVQELIRSDAVGRVFHIRIGNYQFNRRSDWQTLVHLGGGMLNNWGAHRLDQALLLLDGAVEAFFCDLKQTVSAGDAEDHVKVCLKGASGLVVDVEIFSACPIPQPTWTVIGERGMIQGGNKKLTVQSYEKGALPPLEADPNAVPDRSYGRENVPWKVEEVEIASSDPRETVYRRLYASIRRGEPLFVTPESVRQQLALLDRCRATFAPRSSQGN